MSLACISHQGAQKPARALNHLLMLDDRKCNTFFQHAYHGSGWSSSVEERRVRRAHQTRSQPEDARCARRTLRSLHSNPSYGYAFRSGASLTSTSPAVSPGGEMITPRLGLMKYIPVFHPFGVALRSKSVPDGLVTKDFAKERKNRVYFRLRKIFCGFKDQVRARPSGETAGLAPAPAPVILVRNAG